MRFFAGLTSMVAGFGFGLPCAWGIVHLARTGETWTFLVTLMRRSAIRAATMAKVLIPTTIVIHQ